MDGDLQEVSLAIGRLQEGQHHAEEARRVTHEKIDKIFDGLGGVGIRLAGIETTLRTMKPAIDQCSEDHAEVEHYKSKGKSRIETLMKTRLVMFALIGAVAFIAVIAGHGPVAKAGEAILAIFGAL